MTIAFKIPAVPVAQPRQRHAIVAGHVRNYTPADHPANVFKAVCKLAFRQAYQGPPLDGPLVVQIGFVMPRPARLVWKKRPMPRVPHSQKPDVDNLLKSVFDSLNGLAWGDDSQIAELLASKSIAGGDEAPHVWISIDRNGAVTHA